MHESKRKSLFGPRRTTEGREKASSWNVLRWSIPVRYSALILTVVSIALMFPRSSLVEYQFEVGSIWSGDTIRAPFAFPLYKDDATYKRDVDQALAKVLPIYVATDMTAQKMHDTLVSSARSLAYYESKPAFLSDPSWAFLQALPDDDTRPNRLIDLAEVFYQAIATPFRVGVIGPGSKSTILVDTIILRVSKVYEDVVPVNTLYDSASVTQLAVAALAARRGLPANSANFILELFSVLFKPTLIYSSTLIEDASNAARASVTKSQGIVAEGELIVGIGERITELSKLKLSSYQQSRRLREEGESSLGQLIGNIGHVLILIGLALLYLYHFRQRIFNDNLQLGIILAGLLLVALLAWMSLTIKVNLPIQYLILMPLFSMIMAILYDSRTAFYFTVVACFMVAGIRGNDAAIAIACLSSGVLAAYTVRDIKSRTQLFRSIAYSLLGFSFAIIAIGLERSETLQEIGLQVGFAAINATLSPVLTFAAILLIENVFGVATDLKLLEFDNVNHPLLRALADKAPGTYQHTLTIARLAESAAVAIGANALLSKVGAYFHDIGKLAKSEYFVENQMGMNNKHDKITPERSARIIRNHVIDGIELAREYNLPQRIVDFIPMHHGTTVIQYFFDKAREDDPNAKPDDYRYPGPLPQSRETAIVMLADAVEATTRSLPNPTPKAIEETIDKAIKKRFSDGQLDQSEVTLADLTKIKNAFIKNLIGMNHPRIQYKNNDPAPEATSTVEDKTKPAVDPVIPYIDDAFGSSNVQYFDDSRKGEGGDGGTMRR